MSNPFITLRSLFPGPSITEGTVESVEEDGTVVITTVNGGTMRCSTAVDVQEGQTVEIRNQRIESVVEGLQTFEITI